MPVGSFGLKLGFVALSIALAAGFVLAVRWSARRAVLGPNQVRRRTRAALAGVAIWLGVTLIAGAAGALRFSPFPPTMMLLFIAVLGGSIVLARSRVGRDVALELPLSVLVGYQAFRVLVELLLHRSYVEGLMPVQMSYAGYNFDILTGISAGLLGFALSRWRVPTWVVAAWNVGGLLLLLNVLTIALLSAPTPFRRFFTEPANVWVTRAPWVWLPAVMVFAALFGHVLVLVRLARRLPAKEPALAGPPG